MSEYVRRALNAYFDEIELQSILGKFKRQVAEAQARR
jgi:hypothetical protein